MKVDLRYAFALIWALPTMAIAGSYGNDTVATARPVMPDGSAYVDQMAPGNVSAWFAFRAELDQSYAIEVWNPYGPQLTQGNRCVAPFIYEADGITLPPDIPPGDPHTVARDFDSPAPFIEEGTTQGSRRTYINLYGSRKLTFQVTENGPDPVKSTQCIVRVLTTTLASPRWSVNGYTDYIAISNTGLALTNASGNLTVEAILGYVLYYDELGNRVGSDRFVLASNMSIQIAKPNGVAIGGALKGAIRIVHDGAPGAIIAHQLWHNPVTNAYIQYPFTPLVQSYGRGGSF